MYTTEQQKMLLVVGGFTIKYTRIEGSYMNFHFYTQTSNLFLDNLVSHGKNRQPVD